MSDARKPRTLPFAKLGRPHGVHGEQRLFLYNPDTPILAPGLVLLAGTDDDWRELIVESAREGAKSAIVKFEGIHSREDAAELTNAELRVRREDFAALEEGEVYQSDLLGADVRVQTPDGAARIGRVKGFLDSVQDVDTLVVTGPNMRGRLLVLMKREIVLEVDVEAGVLLAPLEDWAPPDLVLEDIVAEE